MSTFEFDGRTIAYFEGGDSGGFPIVYHHGTPSSGTIYSGWAKDAADRGVRLIGYDRPGYGGSSRDPGRSIADAALDVAALLDHLGIERFATWGISGGGPHSLACAALLPGRCVAAATLASVAPYGAEGLDFLAGMGEENIVEFTRATEGEDSISPLLEEWRPGMVGGTAEDLITAMRTVLSEVDANVVSGEAAQYFVDSNDYAIGTTHHGWLDDDLAFVEHWGFELSDISVPVLLWQGHQDLMVPPTHGEWLAKAIPGVDARILPEEGHLTLMLNRVADTHQWLKHRAGA